MRYSTAIITAAVLTVAGCASEPTAISGIDAAVAFHRTHQVITAPTVVDFESYTPGTIHMQDGWLSAGAAGHGCAVYDHELVSNTSGLQAFGAQSLRMSNAVTSGCFGDQTFSRPASKPAGEKLAEASPGVTGAWETRFEAQWDFASTVPTAAQLGLSVVASPDRGDGARMSWVQMADTPLGIEVNFNDVQGAGDQSEFVKTSIAKGLDRATSHTIKITMDFVDGPSNDVVRVFVDGLLRHTGTSWENYFLYSENVPTRIVDRILFRTGGTAAPLTKGNGFLIDNLMISTSTPIGPPTTKDQCMNNEWNRFDSPRIFKNQGDCVSFVSNGK